MQSKKIGRHLKRIARAGVAAGPVVVAILEKRYPKYGFLGRQALEMMGAFKEEDRDNIDSLSTDGENYPYSSLTKDGYSYGQHIESSVQKDALSDVLSEIQERERLLRAEGTLRSLSGGSH